MARLDHDLEQDAWKSMPDGLERLEAFWQASRPRVPAGPPARSRRWSRVGALAIAGVTVAALAVWLG
jgi:ferric-dicitrate binding protein FerR (iron transport regulator)